ncbi:hypothetical protein OC25_18970 [Pedobacter kyungheensis]|uniref:Uncharacterized protein n=1 Tax=Pedobacter kyungheensis TaxID=1069985 RepID=A0A0C1FFQ3_9SPHI|nr:hypothetical protein OC25_18970 [Pedobacter kyungheensis]
MLKPNTLLNITFNQVHILKVPAESAMGQTIIAQTFDSPKHDDLVFTLLWQLKKDGKNSL